MSKSNTHAAQKLAVAGVLTAAAVGWKLLKCSGCRKQMCSGTAYGQCILCRPSRTVVGGSALHSVQA